MIRFLLSSTQSRPVFWADDAAAVIVFDEYGTRTPDCRSPHAVHYAEDTESHTLKCLPNQEMNPEGYGQ